MGQTYNNVKYEFFWDGIFSNWYYSDFIVDGILFNCGEQYMMYHKAMTFGDTKIAQKIMETYSPREQKALGRKVTNYDDNTWSEVRYDLVKKGLKEKFLQNPNLKNYLLAYKGYIIVEASPYDTIWGIGYKDVDAINNIDDWGQNLLGKILTELSNEL